MTELTGGKSTIRIGTRGSHLARWQAEWVADRLRGLHPGLDRRAGRDQDAGGPRPQHAAGGHGHGRGGAVHQGDPAGGRGRVGRRGGAQPEGPAHAGAGRAGPGGGAGARGRGRRPDRAGSPDARRLARGARVGTSSPRRRAQLLYRRPDLEVVTLRGNVETRLNQALEGRLDAVVLAWAGLKRLGLEGHVTHRLEPPEFLPAVGQGALGIECRRDDAAVLALLQPLDDPATHRAVRAERAALAELEGGCIIPMAAWARDVEGDESAMPDRPMGRAGDRRRGVRPRRPRPRRRRRSAARAMIPTAWAAARRRSCATAAPSRCWSGAGRAGPPMAEVGWSRTRLSTCFRLRRAGVATMRRGDESGQRPGTARNSED